MQGKTRTGGNREQGRNRRSRWFRMPWQRKVHRDVKDRLFRFLFEKDKEALLQLYNALNGAHITRICRCGS